MAAGRPKSKGIVKVDESREWAASITAKARRGKPASLRDLNSAEGIERAAWEERAAIARQSRSTPTALAA